GVLDRRREALRPPRDRRGRARRRPLAREHPARPRRASPPDAAAVLGRRRLGVATEAVAEPALGGGTFLHEPVPGGADAADGECRRPEAREPDLSRRRGHPPDALGHRVAPPPFAAVRDDARPVPRPPERDRLARPLLHLILPHAATRQLGTGWTAPHIHPSR